LIAEWELRIGVVAEEYKRDKGGERRKGIGFGWKRGKLV
jgi:hypothetical protein